MQQFQPAHFARLKHLAVFAVVVDAGSFTKAGQRLGIAKSAVSRYVRELEEEVGVELLARTTRKLVLTEPGERFYVDCARFVEAAADSFDAVEPDAHLLGSLHLGATQAFGRHVLLPAIDTFLQQHPRLSVQMSLDDRLVDLVAQGIDLSFRIGSPGTSPSYVARKIAVTRFELFASPAFAARHDLTRVKTLERVLWVLSPLGPNPDVWTLRKGKRTTTVRTRSRLLTDSAEVAADAGERGMGIVGFPASCGPAATRSCRCSRRGSSSPSSPCSPFIHAGASSHRASVDFSTTWSGTSTGPPPQPRHECHTPERP